MNPKMACLATKMILLAGSDSASLYFPVMPGMQLGCIGIAIRSVAPHNGARTLAVRAGSPGSSTNAATKEES